MDARDGRGRSALVIALQQGQLDIARYLLDCGADPLAHAPFAPRRKTSALHAAAAQGYTGIVGEMLRAGIRVDALDGSGRSALLVAAWTEHVDTVALLVEAGSDLNLADPSGNTLLQRP